MHLLFEKCIPRTGQTHDSSPSRSDSPCAQIFRRNPPNTPSFQRNCARKRSQSFADSRDSWRPRGTLAPIVLRYSSKNHNNKSERVLHHSHETVRSYPGGNGDDDAIVNVDVVQSRRVRDAHGVKAAT
ncbi:hypothetical protein GWI33_005847 [Rhynchophorus ferrugineus]|uniref:Uncharacterized protein n=1 Tax=Rhynchophorus ferrugineus TaxID=354439 RepID=A0A834MDD5_RHYFE|nr:hypothetical protein GWI33_005847 [Rhynchophorus ferrugineus]